MLNNFTLHYQQANDRSLICLPAGKEPFDELSNDEVKLKVLGGQTLPKPTKCSDETLVRLISIYNL